MSKLKKAAIAMFALTGLILVIVIIAVASGGDETSTPTVVPDNILPSEDIQEEPSLTSAEQAYLDTTGGRATEVGEAFANLSSLLDDPRYGTDEWTLQVAVQLTTIRLAYDEAMELKPPSSMAEIHSQYSQGMDAYNDMTYLFSRAIDELDSDLLDQAMVRMESGAQFIKEATRLIEEFRETRQE